MENKVLDLKYVSELITQKDIEMFENNDVFISTQTGTGKTRFILGTDTEEGLVDKIKDDKLLYVYNRNELGLQIKRDLLKKYNMEYNLSDDELDKIKTIKNITVTSYQKLEYEVIKCKLRNVEFDVDMYKYIICDEAHYFLTDSDFNNNVEHSFQLLINGWCGLVCNRIFISATMDEIKGLFKKNSIHYLEYDSGIDYSYLDVKYFKKHETIINLIKNDDSDDKWLIFVKSKKDGSYIKNELVDYGISCDYMDSKSKESCIKNESFTSKVLVTTKVLDNGVNISDGKVKHLVINAYDRVTTIQEIGRLRVDIRNARSINLYINAMDGQKFQKQLNTVLNMKQKQLDKYLNDNINFRAYYNSNPNKLDKSLFRIENGIELNELGIIRLENDVKYYNSICDKFKSEGKNAYIKEVLSWLNLEDTFNEDNMLDGNVVLNEEKETLVNYLDYIVGKRLYSDEQQKLSKLIINELITIDTKTDYRTKTLKVSTLEKILRDQLNLNYIVSKVKREDRVINGERIRKNYIEINKIK